MNGITYLGSDYDKTMTEEGQNFPAPEVAEVLEEASGKNLLLTIVTGRFPGQLKVLGTDSLQRILANNSRLNEKNIHVYGGGSVISDAENNVYSHDDHKFEDDQIEGITSTIMDLIEKGDKPGIVFQGADYSVKNPEQWTNGKLTFFYTDPNQVTENRRKLYENIVPMPNRETLVRQLKDSNPAKVIIISSLHGATNGLSTADIAEQLAVYQLGVTGKPGDGIDVSKGNITKVSGIEKTMALLGIAQLNLYAGDSFGPHGNDMPVFQHQIAKYGIVVVHGDERPDMSFSKIPYSIVEGSAGYAGYLRKIVNSAEG